jgi:hypothetical protein
MVRQFSSTEYDVGSTPIECFILLFYFYSIIRLIYYVSYRHNITLIDRVID